MSDDFFARATLIHTRVQRLACEAQTAPHERVLAIRDEMEVCLQSLEDIREEQLLAQLTPEPPKPRRRWWRRRGVAS